MFALWSRCRVRPLTIRSLVRDFLNRGMNIMRVNCAHDSAAEWLRMVENLRAAEKETGKACKIALDLGSNLRRNMEIWSLSLLCVVRKTWQNWFESSSTLERGKLESS